MDTTIAAAPAPSAPPSSASLLGASAPAPAPAPAAAPTPAPAAQGEWDWSPHAKDEDLGWVQSKGYKTPGDLVKAARNAEKLIGHEKVPLPKDDNDAEGWNRVYDRLGRPKDPKDYKLDLPAEGVNQALVDRMTKTLHAAGVSQRQAKQIVGDYLKFGTEAQQQEAQQQQAARTQEVEQLKTEWGAALDRQSAIADRAVAAFCGDGEFDAIVQAIGPAKAVKLFNKIGNGLTEDKRVTDEGGSPAGALTPEQAKYEIGQKQIDPNFMKAYMDRNHPGHDAAMKEMQRLHQFAFPK